MNDMDIPVERHTPSPRHFLSWAWDFLCTDSGHTSRLYSNTATHFQHVYVCNLMKKLSGDGKIVLIVTHDVELIEVACTASICLGDSGRMEIAGARSISTKEMRFSSVRS